MKKAVFIFSFILVAMLLAAYFIYQQNKILVLKCNIKSTATIYSSYSVQDMNLGEDEYFYFINLKENILTDKDGKKIEEYTDIKINDENIVFVENYNGFKIDYIIDRISGKIHGHYTEENSNLNEKIIHNYDGICTKSKHEKIF